MKKYVILTVLLIILSTSLPAYAQQEEGDTPSKPLVSALAIVYFLLTTFLEVLEVIFFFFIWKEIYTIIAIYRRERA